MTTPTPNPAFMLVQSSHEFAPGAVRVRCPHCSTTSVMESLAVRDLLISPAENVTGQRRCPNPQCRGHIFFVVEKGTNVVRCYPPERLDFDATNIPAAVSSAISEAIGCHAAQCYVAAAIMVRKTLEELCHDRGATGPNLPARIRSLSNRVVVPQELLDGLDDLRLLGNDAAHIESREFNQIGREEVEVGIEFAKEVLKAVYQYGALLGRIRSLRSNP